MEKLTLVVIALSVLNLVWAVPLAEEYDEDVPVPMPDHFLGFVTPDFTSSFVNPHDVPNNDNITPIAEVTTNHHVQKLLREFTARQNQKCACGRINGRIVGGQIPSANKYPGLCLLMTQTSQGTFGCGSALIDPNNALTAAHCIDGPNARATIYCGLQNKDSNGMRAATAIPVSRIIKHERYDSKNINNDIAVLQLSREAPCTTKISPLCLPRSVSDFEGRLCQAAGWGETSWGRGTNTLHEMTTTVQRPSNCTIPRQYYDQATQICLNKPSSGTSLCRGDSGGPIMCPTNNGYVVAGLNSYVMDHCQYPNASAKVFHFLSWLLPKLKQ